MPLNAQRGQVPKQPVLFELNVVRCSTRHLQNLQSLARHKLFKRGLGLMQELRPRIGASVERGY